MNIETPDDGLIVMCAHNYCLGRQTYMVSVCIGFLHKHWGSLKPDTRAMILRDTALGIMTDCAGAPIDIEEWRKFLCWGMAHVGMEQQLWVKDAVAYRGPLPV